MECGAWSRLASTLPTVMLMASFLLFRIMKEPCVCQRCHIYLPKSMRLLTLSSNGQTVTICFVSALLFFLLCFDFPPFLHAKFFFSSSSIHPQHQHLHFLDVSIKASDRCFDILNALLNMYLALFPSTLMVRHVESRNLSKLEERWSRSQAERAYRETTLDMLRMHEVHGMSKYIN